MDWSSLSGHIYSAKQGNCSRFRPACPSSIPTGVLFQQTNNILKNFVQQPKTLHYSNYQLPTSLKVDAAHMQGMRRTMHHPVPFGLSRLVELPWGCNSYISIAQGRGIICLC